MHISPIPEEGSGSLLLQEGILHTQKEELGLILLDNMKKLPVKVQLDTWHKRKRNTPEEILYGYNSVMSSGELFQCIEKILVSSLEGMSRKGLLLTENWIKSGLYESDYDEVKSYIASIIHLSKDSTDKKTLLASERVQKVWNLALTSEDSESYGRGSFKSEYLEESQAFGSSEEENKDGKTKAKLQEEDLSICHSLDAAIRMCDHYAVKMGDFDRDSNNLEEEDLVYRYSHVVLTEEFRSFFVSLECHISPIDILRCREGIGGSGKTQRRRVEKRIKRRNSFSHAIRITDKVVRHIMNNILSSQSRKEAEAKVAFFLKVAKCALENGDAATAMAIRTALDNGAISRLKLLEERPKYAVKERLELRGKKRRMKLRMKLDYDIAKLNEKQLHKDLAIELGFSKIRNLELRGKEKLNPSFFVIVSTDVEKIKEVAVVLTDENDGSLFYNPERIASFASIVKTFHERQLKFRKAPFEGRINLMSLFCKHDFDEEVLSARSLFIKPRGSKEENWYLGL